AVAVDVGELPARAALSGPEERVARTAGGRVELAIDDRRAVAVRQAERAEPEAVAAAVPQRVVALVGGADPVRIVVDGDVGEAVTVEIVDRELAHREDVVGEHDVGAGKREGAVARAVRTEARAVPELRHAPARARLRRLVAVVAEAVDGDRPILVGA